MTIFYFPIRYWMAVSFGILALGLCGALSLARTQLPMVWMDEANGFAIGGYDPVDYFVKGAAVRPNKGIEAVWGGVSWNFRNIGNRGAFLSHPHIYAPRFGGMDPFQLINNRAVQGNPALFDVYENRLYLFYSGASLLRWKQGRQKYVQRAALTWPKMATRLGLNSAKWMETVQPENKSDFLFPRSQ